MRTTNPAGRLEHVLYERNATHRYRCGNYRFYVGGQSMRHALKTAPKVVDGSEAGQPVHPDFQHAQV
ncbi:MAG: hypothetical protein P8Y36_04840, partial [Alphaproteobacteria bacterium]